MPPRVPTVLPRLEVIVTSVADALAAQRGSADRLEVVSTMARDGLTPPVELVAALRDAVTLPLRVMLRPHAGFGIDPPALDALRHTAESLTQAGATEFVLGFLGDDGRLDWPAVEAVVAAVHPTAWTLHRVFDHVADRAAAFQECTRAGGPDVILTAGHPDGLDAGLPTLKERAAWQTGRLRFVAGGGLRPEYVAPLLASGITEFHAGRAVRRTRSWVAPVDEALVRHLVQTVRSQAHY